MGELVGSSLTPPGFLVPLGFKLRRRTDADGLSPEAQQRVNEKIADVQSARLYALAHAHECVIGAIQ